MCALREARRRKQIAPAFWAKSITNLGMPDIFLTSYPLIVGSFMHESCTVLQQKMHLKAKR